MNPLFSVIIPTYNRGNVIIDTIQSLLNQSSSNFEIIVVDDGSDDNTFENLAKFYEEKKIRYFFHENKGVSAARNCGAEIAKGEFLVFLDSDDLVEREWLFGFEEIVRKTPNVELIQSGYKKNDFQTDKYSIHVAIPGKYNVGLAGTFALKNELFHKVKGYDESLKYSENMELLLRVGFTNPIAVILGKSGLIYRETQNGGSKNLLNIVESLNLILKKHDRRLSSHVKHLFNQKLGVIYLRLRDYHQSRKHLLKALVFKPLKLSTWVRFLISCFPPLASLLYRKN